MTTWFPIGPDFVFAPRDQNFNRLSRRNELGRQGLVNSIAVDPTDASTIYTCETPTSGGNSAFRTDDGGSNWTPIVDALQQFDPANINPSCIALHPNLTGWVYLATFSGRVYVSPNTKGATWNPMPFNIGSGVFKLVVDPRDPATPSMPATNPATTIVYAAGSNGVWRSIDGGTTFTQVLAGNLTAFAARMPTDGSTADFYTGIANVGVFYSANPTGTGSWTNLTTAGIGLPAQVSGTTTHPSGNFDSVRIDYCRGTRRAYVLFFNTVCDASGNNCSETTASLYTSTDPTASWSSVPMTSPPNPVYGLYDSSFAVASNSSSTDGSGDVLFFGGIDIFRSIDGGRTWQDISAAGDDFHNDYHTWVFFPDNPPSGVVPATFIGVDGGIAVSTGLADPTVTFPLPAGSFDETGVYSPSPALQNYNHGKQSSAVYTYNSDPAIGALGYMGIQDTGINAGDSALMWRGIYDFDGGPVACTQGADGVKLWYVVNGGMYLATDKGEYSPAAIGMHYGSASGPGMAPNSNFVVHASGDCLAGVNPQFSATSIAAAVAIGMQTVTPGSMTNIGTGTTLTIDTGANQENVQVTGTTGTTFTATFAKAHSPGVSVTIQRRVLGSIDQTGVATPVSQDFGSDAVNVVAVSANNPALGIIATDDQRVLVSNNLNTGSPTWSEATGSKPGALAIASLCIDRNGNQFVLLQQSVTTGSGESAVTGPLFLIVSGNWQHLSCTGLPSTGFNFGRIVADPMQDNTLYAAQGARIFALTFPSPGGTVLWTDISGTPPWGLPGQWIYDLWIGNVGSAVTPKVLLRAAVPTGGIWEADVTAGASAPALGLYLRDNVLDLGRLPSSPDGVANPYNPSDTLYHYECADIKIDALQRGTPPNPDFFQTDPEGTLPLSHVWFDQLRDNSNNLPSSDSAMVHVQVRNRGTSAANNVKVWALYANAGAGLPALPGGFWSQFTVLGQIVPAMSDAPWQPVGLPVTLSGIDPAHPQVASWNWTVPALPSGDPGHYCVIALVHSSGSPINETGLDVDVITPTNKQIGQKNLHIGPPLPPHGSPGGGRGSGGAGAPGRRTVMREYIEFHNPTVNSRESSLVIDLRNVPPEIRVSFALTKLDTATPLPGAITGIKVPGATHSHGLGKKLAEWLDRIEDELEETSGELLEWIGKWLENLGRRIEDRPALARRWKTRHLPRFEPTVYTALPSTRVEVSGVRLLPNESAAMLLSIQNRGDLPQGSSYTFHIQQWSGGKLVGGSAYVVSVAGQKPVPQPQPEFEELDNRALAPYLVNLVAQAEANLGKK